MSPSASHLIKGLATKYTTVKWPIGDLSQSLSEAVGVKSCQEFVFHTGCSLVFILKKQQVL